ncbi:hypothetical protein ScPMuIL_003009 [Solemya velum]
MARLGHHTLRFPTTTHVYTYYTGYDDCKLLNIHTSTPEQREQIQGFIEETEADVWQSTRELTTVVVCPFSDFLLLRKLNDSGIRFDVVVANLQTRFDSDYSGSVLAQASASVHRGGESVFMKLLCKYFSVHCESPEPPKKKTEIVPNIDIVGKFASHAQIGHWLSQISARHSHISSLENIGTSYEGRNMTIIKIGKPRTDGANKPIIWIDAGVHAREWISTAVSISTINTLLTKSETDRRVATMLEKFDWYILPVANPDGYYFSRNGHRFWRKTRRPQFPCFGVDMNRNFDINFGGAGSSASKCSEVYRGTKAFSEPEAANMRNVLTRHKDRIRGVVSLHSYGQLLLLPYSFTSTKPPDYLDLERLANVTAEAIERVNGRRYGYGTAPDLLYPTSGSSIDWAKMKLGIKYTLGIELPPHTATASRLGFAVSEREIAPSAEEVFAALSAMSAHIDSPLGRT